MILNLVKPSSPRDGLKSTCSRRAVEFFFPLRVYRAQKLSRFPNVSVRSKKTSRDIANQNKYSTRDNVYQERLFLRIQKVSLRDK